MPPKKQNQTSDLTLRFKHHKTTILLLCQSTQTFTSIRQDLLNTMKAIGIKNINQNSIPEDPDDVILGVPMDKNDLNKGWVNLEIPEFDEGDVKSKGGVKKGSVLNKNPLGAGLGEGALLAFRFKDKNKQEDEMELGEDYDVIMPSYEDESTSQSQR
ncbi:uncharacterized protein KY384_001402 [Bacidia gigantensis]|uniref:uncharacterized protein n=1 Tax=Bacidia gigantensis TaxID=2732470 RepID=UPI001D04D6AE|nr:uncharacterized protein KY384_001402 [Bacidia gigantensis]KAG8533661.1 hypothetical protein KY384_001402 [Bacidia gigantensis]